MELDKALEITRFEKCEFGPDDETCEKCRKPNLQMYYRRTDYWENEGEYFCQGCVINEAVAIESLIEIECKCGEVFTGWPHQKGDICMDCYTAEHEANT